MQRFADRAFPRAPADHELPLFENAGILLQSERHCVSNLAQRSSHISTNLWYLIISLKRTRFLDAKTFSASQQLSFQFMDHTRPRVVKFVAKSRFPYLDYGVYELLRRSPETAKTGLRLQKYGMRYLGQLVQFTADELLQYKFITPDIVKTIECQLADCGLSLGAAVPRWNAGFWEGTRVRHPGPI